MVKNENFIAIQGWMVNELKLKGNSLLIYAIIYGFSQVEGQVFSGSLQYLADWTNSTKQGVMNCLKKMVDDGLIGKNEKYINGVKFVEYYAKKFNGGIKQSLMGIKKSLPNNIIYNIDNNIDSNNKLLEEPQTFAEYGNSEINNLFDEWEKKCGFKITSKVKLNRYACNRLIKSKGVDSIKQVLPIVAEANQDEYSPTIANFMDLETKWNNLAIWYQKKMLVKKKKTLVVV